MDKLAAAALQDDDDEIVVVDPGAQAPGAQAIFVMAPDEIGAIGEAEVESLLEPVLDVSLAAGHMTHASMRCQP